MEEGEDRQEDQPTLGNIFLRKIFPKVAFFMTWKRFNEMVVITCLKFISRTFLQFRQKILPVFVIPELNEDFHGPFFFLRRFGLAMQKSLRAPKFILKK